MNFQPIIDQLPMILVALGFLFWAVSKAMDTYAQKNPAIDKWDARAATMHTISARYAQAIEWLVSSGFCKWTGAQKLEELTKRVREFEALWDKGSYIEAISGLSGFYQSALSKIQAAKGIALGELNGGASNGEAPETDPLANTPAS
ncbi:MAG: hypothetical protein HQM09_15255 [Candidatus Riflebacteria bacterium]|nr:hypothetical protein [Candidatus Riflebacteria bacterium]